MTLEPDQMLSRYRLVETIGEGGMGVVWKALDTELNRYVAVKILPAELTADPERRLRFKREAQAAAALNHPNIAVIHEVGEDEGIPFLVMELVEGKSLRALIHRRPLPLEEWLRLALPIAQALAHAHRQGIVHRDLKPENVVITNDGRVKLLDFGLAKLLHPEKLPEASAREVSTRLETISGELTRAGKVLGTVAYMSPEQAKGKPVDHRSDLFSLGVMMYEMATGRLPFLGESDVEALSATITQEPPTLSEAIGGIPIDAERVVRKALEKDPERRYQGAADLAADLSNLRRDLDSGRAALPSRDVAGTATPHGPRPPAPSSIRRYAIIVAGTLVVVAALLVYLQRRPAVEPGAAPTTGASGQASAAGKAAPERPKIVVLPFENLGPPEEEYFAAGMTEEITSRLAKVSGLGVISRKSAVRYAGTDKTIREIGEELGVDYLLEGTVRWARQPDGTSRVRITPQLIQVADDTHLWAETYDEVIDDIFKVQSEIAGKVISQIGGALAEPGGGGTEPRPTDNPEAYNAYLRGLHYMERPNYSERDLQLAIEMFQRAAELDPGFALAHARLGRAHLLLHFMWDPTTQRVALAKRAIDKAVELAPESPEVHIALGYYHYYGHREYEQALREFAVAGRELPNDADLLALSAYVYRRQGRWKEALANLEKALELDPLDAAKASELGNSYLYVRRYPDAIRFLDRSIALTPDQFYPYCQKAWTFWIWRGTTEEARAALEAMPGTDDTFALQTWYWQEIFEGRYQEAIDRLPSESLDPLLWRNLPKDLLVARAYDLMNEAGLARDAYDAARKRLEKELQVRPDDYQLHADLGAALAGLGRKEEAIRHGRRAVEMLPISKDARDGSDPLENLVQIYTRMGEHDAALDELEHLLSIPSGCSIPYVRLNPLYRPLLDHPRFKELERRFGGRP